MPVGHQKHFNMEEVEGRGAVTEASGMLSRMSQVCGACRWGRELFVDGKAKHSHIDALQRSQAWIPIRASIPASDCYTLPGSSLVWREILANLAGFCHMPRPTTRCSNHQALSLGVTQLVQHFLRANSFKPVQEIQRLSVALKEMFSPSLLPRDRVQSIQE